MSSLDGGAGGALSALAGRLRRLRSRRYASEVALARALGWSQSRVSRLETGRALPTRDDLEAWVEVTIAGDTSNPDAPNTCPSPRVLVEELWAARELARTERSVRTPGPVVSPIGWIDQYAEKIERAVSSSQVREFQIRTLPLVLQTHDFLVERLDSMATAVPTLIDDQVIETFTRMRVQDQDLLYDPHRSLQLVVSEAALYSAPGHTMAEQLDRVVEIATAVSTTLDFRVLPHDADCPVLAMTAFTLYDDAVLVPSLGPHLWLTEAGVLHTYAMLMDELARRSLGGPDAVELVHRARRRLS